MVERAQGRTAPVVEVTSTRRTALRLKSWLPEYTSGAKPVVIGGWEFPSNVGTTKSGPMRVLCVGPGEWLLISHENEASGARPYMETDPPTPGIALADLTSGLVGLEVQGSGVREVLSKGCGLDLDPRSFPPGRCARTRFAQIPVVVECLDDPPRYQLYIARSYLHYLQSWLADAAVEFGGDSRGP
jgi:sarcosine oxidase subunit gamma